MFFSRAKPRSSFLPKEEYESNFIYIIGSYMPVFERPRKGSISFYQRGFNTILFSCLYVLLCRIKVFQQPTLGILKNSPFSAMSMLTENSIFERSIYTKVIAMSFFQQSVFLQKGSWKDLRKEQDSEYVQNGYFLLVAICLPILINFLTSKDSIPMAVSGYGVASAFLGSIIFNRFCEISGKFGLADGFIITLFSSACLTITNDLFLSEESVLSSCTAWIKGDASFFLLVIMKLIPLISFFVYMYYLIIFDGRSFQLPLVGIVARGQKVFHRIDYLVSGPLPFIFFTALYPFVTSMIVDFFVKFVTDPKPWEVVVLGKTLTLSYSQFIRTPEGPLESFYFLVNAPHFFLLKLFTTSLGCYFCVLMMGRNFATISGYTPEEFSDQLSRSNLRIAGTFKPSNIYLQETLYEINRHSTFTFTILFVSSMCTGVMGGGLVSYLIILSSTRQVLMQLQDITTEYKGL